MEIRTITDGETITEAGAYRMNMSWYHDQCTDGVSVSSTGIRKAALQSPLAFWKTSDLNPKRYPPKPENESLILGKAAHCLILGDEVFAENFAYVPDDAPKRPTSVQIANFERDRKWSPAAQEGGIWWAKFDAEANGRSLLTAEQVTRIGYMAENLAANPLCVELLKADLVEISMIWQDEITGLWLKSRPDCIPSNGFDFSDLKTIAPKGSDLALACQRSITDYGYYVQMAMAVEGAERVFGTTAQECALVFTQTTEPYDCLPIRIDEETLYLGRVLLRHGINAIARGLETGDWPGIGRELKHYSLPPTMQHWIGERQLNGELPMLERITA